MDRRESEDWVSDYFGETQNIVSLLRMDIVCRKAMQDLIDCIAEVQKNKARLFVFGVGGSAAHASHAVNDFRKLCGINAICPTDNVSEMTARINDGWKLSSGTTLVGYEWWLAQYLSEVHMLSSFDAILFLSVGGGDFVKKVSMPMIRAIEWSGAPPDDKAPTNIQILGICGRESSYLHKSAEACLVVPTSMKRITPHTEGLTSVILHCIVSHPKLQINPTKW